MANIIIDTASLEVCKGKIDSNIDKSISDLSVLRTYNQNMDSVAFSGNSAVNLTNRINKDIDLYTNYFNTMKRYSQAIDNLANNVSEVISMYRF